MASSEIDIGTVERETGLSKDTLRVWERRYGFPDPRRNRHGERVYPAEQVGKLRLISRLLDRGLRPGQLVGASIEELRARVAASEPAPAPLGAGAADNAPFETTLKLLAAYDEAGLRSHLSRTLQRLGLLRFILEFAAPMNAQVGDAWSRGVLAVNQEHLYSEQMQYHLRHGIGTIYPGRRTPGILLTTLPGEAHQLGLLMAHACLALEGVRCISLGVQTPIGDIVQAARQHGTEVVGLSFSEALRLKTARTMLQELRMQLPQSIEIWAGGTLWAGTRHVPPGIRLVSHLERIPHQLAEFHERRAITPTAAV
jgi:DNA-binding transcriptional MerR regulator/methylmalonyl-CoA mutase cobalamin-binding subunit